MHGQVEHEHARNIGPPAIQFLIDIERHAQILSPSVLDRRTSGVADTAPRKP